MDVSRFDKDVRPNVCASSRSDGRTLTASSRVNGVALFINFANSSTLEEMRDQWGQVCETHGEAFQILFFKLLFSLAAYFSSL